MAGAKVPLTFRIYKGDTFVREETLSQPVIKVGKLSSSHLRLDDDTVSRMHAVIEVTGPGDVSIIDLGSTKGTHVNGQKINKARLQSGDQIVVGDTRIEIVIDGGDRDAQTPTRIQPQLQATAPSGQPASPLSRQSAAARRVPTPVPAPGLAPPARAATPQPIGRLTTPTPVPRPAPAPAPVAGPPSAASPTAPPNFGMDAVNDMGGARAVEVAAMMGDSVVGVKHVMNPRGGKVSWVTYAMFAGGAVMLMLAAIAFGVAVENAKFNKASRAAWISENRVAYEWRPRRISLGFDWMAFGGALAGLVTLTSALVRLRSERQSPYYRIGTDSGVEFPTTGAPASSFPLVAPLGDDFVFNFARGMEGELSVDGQTTKLIDLHQQGNVRKSSQTSGAMELTIPHKARIKVRVGKNTFLVSSVPQPRRQAAPLFASIESRVMAFFAGSAIVHLGLWALLRTIPPDPHALQLDLGGGENRLTRVQSKAQEDPKQDEQLKKDSSEQSGGTGTKMALDEGKMGKKDSDRKSGRYQIQDRGVSPQLARQNARDLAREQGIAGALRANSGGIAALTGLADFSSGDGDLDVFGGMMGDEAGEMEGGFGGGVSGFGPGGGGTGYGTIGSGRYGTIGHGRGTGSGFGVGSGRGGMRGRRAAVPAVRIGNATASGDLDKNIIRRYIRRQINRIRYCYEKELNVRPGLGGTVVSQFQISPQGGVLNSTAKGVHDNVARCVAGVIKTIKFPKPRGGGLVQVRYPFTFRPSGG
ncbi:MAG: AgmX/PglI C-terminal domain-containing protein [Proteobacteria bacterium]|nr:AgmX/PglI C-terminal domain-containing protein [Pseudomonadota bacterium]